ncbi:RnfABCDGE type electron transport complex subunit G [Clostridium sp. AM58-1XD]|uniref:RnfABCDGE type electron transport complex subunit G n=1 Tax=Clostridium sp. AM58-1XD TaxID=2292307 RepID=UPI000E513242|nr:RnfABCDGE type electron transport complex subunit G [Clostridium sp. AM58-1XD]RGZ00967.1 RnfABCDGE type electron transport complex subunit G [Clostridium sp. AM58-1XD]
MKKGGFMKDAMILFVITLVSGVLLGGVYEVTKSPIEAANKATQMAAYKQVLPEAADFDDSSMAPAVEKATADLAGMSDQFGNVYVDSAAEAKDASGAVMGYVVNSTSKDGFGGEVKITVGITADGTVNGIAFLSLSETPGLGMNAQNESFYGQFAGKNQKALTVVKDNSGAADNDKINAMSGATITSKAVTNAVNAALYFAENCVTQ